MDAVGLELKNYGKKQKNQKQPGCSRTEGQGLQVAGTQDPGEEEFQRPETLPLRGDPGSRIFLIFLSCLLFLLFAFRKNQ